MNSVLREKLLLTIETEPVIKFEDDIFTAFIMENP